MYTKFIEDTVMGYYRDASTSIKIYSELDTTALTLYTVYRDSQKIKVIPTVLSKIYSFILFSVPRSPP